MATNVIMPKQGLQMTEGTILKWLKCPGESVAQGEPLFEMETDKLTITIDAEVEGVLLGIFRGEGETVPITQTIAVIGEEGESLPDILDEESAPATEQPQLTCNDTAHVAEKSMQNKVYASPRAKVVAEQNGIDIAHIQPTGNDETVVERDVLRYIKATPLARKIAQVEVVDLEDVPPTGANNKVVKADVMNILNKRNRSIEQTSIPITGMRRAIAQKMSKSLAVHAQAMHSIDVDMTNARIMRQTYLGAQKSISYNDIVILATIKALKEHPIMNAVMTQDEIITRDYVNMGVAVAVEGGLVVPVIKNADKMSIEEISSCVKRLASESKENRLSADSCQGGTFTISNLGMYGLKSFSAIINTPQSGILAVGAIAKTPVVYEDKMEIRHIMNITLTYDHRLVDGAPAAQFIAKIKGYIENPYLML